MGEEQWWRHSCGARYLEEERELGVAVGHMHSRAAFVMALLLDKPHDDEAQLAQRLVDA